MSSSPPAVGAECPHCGAPNARTRTACWLCKKTMQAVDTAATASNPYAFTAAPRTAYHDRASWQISVASLLATMTLIAVLFGMFRFAPGIAVVLGIVLVPAWVQTVISLARRRAWRGQISAAERVSIFASSVLITVLVIVLICAIIAAMIGGFCGLIFLSGGMGRNSDVLAITIGMLLGSTVVGTLAVLGLWAARRWTKQLGRPAQPPKAAETPKK